MLRDRGPGGGVAAQEGRLRLPASCSSLAAWMCRATVHCGCISPLGIGLSSSESQRQHHGHEEAWGKSLKPQGLVVEVGQECLQQNSPGISSGWRPGQFSMVGSQGNL